MNYELSSSSLKVYLIVLFMYIVVEEGDAVVVEVEGDSRLRILLDLLPGPSRRGIVVNALGHDHARWRHLRQRET